MTTTTSSPSSAATTHGDKTISSFLSERIAAGDFPSAVYLVAAKGRAIFSDALGDAVLIAPSQIHAATRETIYDLASLTKPLVTGLLSAMLVERGEISPRDRMAHFIPEFAADEAHRDITLEGLLTHTSGLPAWLPLRQLTEGDVARVLSVIAAQPLAAAPGSRVIYSDLGFITLGFLLEKLFALPLAAIAQEEIFASLKLERTVFNPPAAWRDRIAAAEEGNRYEREMAAARNEQDGQAAFALDDWRERLIWGEVHDGNAYFLGGAAGHAGLFSDAHETWRLAEQFLPHHSSLLQPPTCALFQRDLTAGLNEARSFAWQLAATPDSTAGHDLPPDSFGHTGFTGTSCWIDPQRENIFILLTNRTHAHVLPFANINGVRRRFHSLAMAALASTVL